MAEPLAEAAKPAAESQPAPAEPGLTPEVTEAEGERRTAGRAGELREALDDAVERLRSLFRRKGSEG
jgi:hypothetical protein